MLRVIKIIFQVLLIYGIYYVGVYLQTTFKLSIPGSIIGMILLFLLLMTKLVKESMLIEGAKFLLSHLSLLFLPATVGVVGYLAFFKGKGIVTVAIVIMSTMLVMVCSGGIGQFTARKFTENREKSAHVLQVEKVDK